MSGLKKTTGITGLAVAKNPQHTLLSLYGKILRVLNSMPKDAAYRKYTEEIVANRMAIVKDTCDVKVIERQINCGQVEEVIVQATNELRLARQMALSKPWEPPLKEPPPNQWTWPPV